MEFKRLIKKIGLLVLMVIPFIYADVVTASNEDLTYTISVKPVSNQIDKQATYYDLLVEPSQKETLTVIVSNTGKEEKTLRVTPTNAITNQNGVIDYSRQDKDYKYDSNLKIPFTSLVEKEKQVTVPAGKSEEVRFEMTVPKEPFKGMILGGFLVDVVESEQGTDNSASGGVKIVNKFQLVKAVMLRKSEETVKPEVVLNEVKPDLVSYRTAVTANLQNTEPTMFGDMTVEAKVTEKGKKEVLKSDTKKGLEMAPNSNFDYPIMWNNERLDPGEYTLSLLATSGTKKWQFTKDFTITKDESNKLNKEAVELEEPEKPYWLYILIIAIFILLSLILLVLVLRHRAKLKQKQNKAKRSSHATGHKTKDGHKGGSKKRSRKSNRKE